jgi:hypothetical protein
MTLFSELPLNTSPTVRDRYFAPPVLSPFADDMAHRLARLSIGPLLEISADTGVLTQAMASALSAGLTIIATPTRCHFQTRHSASSPVTSASRRCPIGFAPFRKYVGS